MHTDGQIERQTVRQTGRPTNRPTDGETGAETATQTDIYTQAENQIGGQGQTDRAAQHDYFEAAIDEDRTPME